MKKGVYILFFVSICIVNLSNAFGQNDFYKKHFEIDSVNGSRKFKNNLSTEEIDSLKFYNQLDRFKYPNLTSWGGLQLYYYCNNLVYIEGRNNSESDWMKRNYYLYDNRLRKITLVNNDILNGMANEYEFDSTGNVIKINNIKNLEIVKDLYNNGDSLLEFLKKEKLETKYWNLTDVYLDNAEIDSLILEIDKKVKDSTLEKYTLLNKHPCGGFVEGYFNEFGELQFVNSYNSFPEGYIERQIFFYKNGIVYNSYWEINDNEEKDIFYADYKTGKDILIDNSKEKLQFPYMDFIRNVNTCVTSMERQLILEYKTKD